MVKKGNEIGITILTTTAKEGCDELKRWHYKVNDIIFKYQQRYIGPETAKRIYNKLVEYGTELRDMNVPERAKLKQEQLRAGLRERCISLKRYTESVMVTSSDKLSVEQAVKYQVAKFVKAKKEGLTTSVVINLLEEDIEVWMDLVMEYPEVYEIKTDTFIKAHQEMMMWLNAKYGIGN